MRLLTVANLSAGYGEIDIVRDMNLSVDEREIVTIAGTNGAGKSTLVKAVMGLAPRGQGARAIDEGWVYRDGKLPVNLSGGLKAKGHPVGATGVSQHVLAAMQLSGTAGDMQLPGARRAAVHNMGGLAVANYVSVLEAV